MTKRLAILTALVLAALLNPTAARAQLSSNPDKFLGNITTSYQVDYGKEAFHTLWNQITPENETKWASVEGAGRGQFNFSGADRAANYAKQHKFPFKFHTLVWGSQFPGWVKNLSAEERYKAIVEWFDAVKKHYPNLEIIDVVNEAIEGHQADTHYIKEALGGGGRTGYDWIIKAFQMAYERWPDAILVYNDFNTFRWQKNEYIDLVKTLRDAGAPVDAYGCQSHDLTDMNETEFKSAMTEIQNALRMPMYSTEYDIDAANDQTQLQRYKEQIPYMWEADYCAGVTLWGYIHGKTWVDNSGIIKDGKDRPAMTWLRQYMASAKAKAAKSPFPGMKKEASLYIKPEATPTVNQQTTVTIHARMRTKTIKQITLKANSKTVATIEPETPAQDNNYTVAYTPATKGRHALIATVTTTDGQTYTRHGALTAYAPRTPYKDHTLPGTIQAEDYDNGGEGLTYHDNDTQDQGNTNYRTPAQGPDIVTAPGGHALGYTAQGEWAEYTVDITQAGTYAYQLTASAGVEGAAVQLSLHDPATGTATNITDNIAIPQTGQGNWNTYATLHGRTTQALPEGKYQLRLNITGSNGNIDKITLKHIDLAAKPKLTLKADPKPATINQKTTITATPSEELPQGATVTLYADGQLLRTTATQPYTATYTPKTSGQHTITAHATLADGSQTPLATMTLAALPPRKPYPNAAKPAAVPGTIQLENYDTGGEGNAYHDTDEEDKGNTKYRTDSQAGPDIVTTPDGGRAIGYTEQGEWLQYTVNVAEAGTYEYTLRASSGTTGARIKITLHDDPDAPVTLAQVNIPKTGDNNWDNYRDITGKLLKTLEAGPHTLRVAVTGASGNLDALTLTLKVPTAVEAPEAQAENKADATAYDLLGRPASDRTTGIIIKNGKKFLRQ